jgi:hypothetical protein
VAGFVGRVWDEVMMRVTELFMAFPTIILAMAVTAALGPEIRNAVLALIIVRWTNYARLTRGLVIEAKTAEYVEAARALGAKNRYLLFKTLLPNTIAPVVVYGSLDIGNAILLFAGLSFLGLGPEPSSPEWGRMISIGIHFFDQWWMWLFPGLAIASLVMAFNFIGDGLRDMLDPRTRSFMRPVGSKPRGTCPCWARSRPRTARRFRRSPADHRPDPRARPSPCRAARQSGRPPRRPRSTSRRRPGQRQRVPARPARGSPPTCRCRTCR